MPRIDPERLLKCLQPLLDPTSGAIKSSDEVDKILGLMSKFSKKLVSKCIYINILRATDPGVLDLYMQRGGWNLVYGWTSDGVSTKNFNLLKEVLSLLFRTPVSIPRLKENKFPLLIKTLSKDCEDEGIKNLAKQIVSRWISIAKGENPPLEIPSQIDIPIQQQHISNIIRLPVEQNHIVEESGVPELEHLNMNADSLLNIDPSIMPDADNQLMDFDISHNDLPDIDFNLDILSKVVDQEHLDANLADVIEDQMTLKPEPTPTTTITVNPPQIPLLTHVQSQVKEDVVGMYQVQPAPKLFIKTIGGQRTVVQSLGSLASSTQDGHYCVVIKDGKNYLMKLKTAEPKPITSIVVQEQINIKPPEPVKLQDPKEIKDSHHRKSPKNNSVTATTNKIGGESPVKTYGSKSKSPVSKDNTGSNKRLNQVSKPLDKLESKDKDKKSSKDKAASSDTIKKSKSSSSSSKNSAAAIAAKQQAEEERLREEIRKQKALMKKRQKEAVKQKQQEKDQETLKKLNLSSTSPSSGLKIPKIPKRPTSFAAAIGISGSDGADKIKKVSTDKTEKHTSGSKSEEPTTPTTPRKFYGRVEDPEEDDKPKERRHKVKVFTSSKSRSEDLLKEMTESSKPKHAKEKEKEKDKDEIKPSNSLGNSIPAIPPPSKVSKRLSSDAIEKPGDIKKMKLGDNKSEKSKDGKESPPSAKEKEKKKPTILLKESSLFMDMLNATTETSKSSKRKRRPSTGSEKGKNELSSPIEKSPKLHGKEDSEHSKTAEELSAGSLEHQVKPVFNFYRDTLNDSEEDTKEPEPKGSDASPQEEKAGNADEEGSFTPRENDGQLKSALCLHRSRNRAKKFVRWRDDDELKEFYYFEMDETERVNVTKQKDFTELTQDEKAYERSMRRKMNEEEEPPKTYWRLRKIAFSSDVLQPAITSQEKHIQEEREKNVLGLFLPPGATLPATASEPDTIIPMDRVEPKLIPVEDVNSITKVCDYRTHAWPLPKTPTGGKMISGYSMMMPSHKIDEIPPNPIMHPFPPAPDYSNPWNTNNIGFNVPPMHVPNMGDMSSFQQFPPPAMGLNLIGSAPPPAINFANPFAFPPPMAPQGNGPPGVIDAFLGNANRDGRMGNPNRNRFNEADQRRNFHNNNRENNRDRGNRDRDYRDDRGGRDRDRDRDYRRRDRDNNDRNYRNNDRDRNNKDFRGGNGNARNIRKDIPCRYYQKGFCQNGSRCEFAHDSSNFEDNRTNQTNRQDDINRPHRSPDSPRDVDFRQTSTDVEESWDTPSYAGKVTDSTRFALPPSSPTEPEIHGVSAPSESTRVIPV